MKIGLEDRQKQLESAGYSGRVKAYLSGLCPGAAIQDVRVLVTGQRYFPDPYLGPSVELSLTIHVLSTNAPTALASGTNPLPGPAPDRFTFVQLGSPVHTTSYTTLLSAQYTGNDPPTIPP